MLLPSFFVLLLISDTPKLWSVALWCQKNTGGKVMDQIREARLKWCEVIVLHKKAVLRVCHNWDSLRCKPACKGAICNNCYTILKDTTDAATENQKPKRSSKSCCPSHDDECSKNKNTGKHKDRLKTMAQLLDPTNHYNWHPKYKKDRRHLPSQCECCERRIVVWTTEIDKKYENHKSEWS